MKLQLVLVNRDINNRSDFKGLSEINQNQLLIALSRWYGKRISIGKAIRLKLNSNLWKVVPEDNCNFILYEYWEVNCNYGVYFNPNSINALVIYSNGSMIMDKESTSSLGNIIEKLQGAERYMIEKDKYCLDTKGQVIDFRSTMFIPDSISNWRNLLRKIKLSERFIICYSKYFDKKCWEAIARYSDLTKSVIRLYGKKMGWRNISIYQTLSNELINEFQNDLDWTIISSTHRIDESFIRAFKGKILWEVMSIDSDLSLDCIREFRSKINFKNVNIKSLDFIYEFETEEFNWLEITNNFEIDEKFIRKFQSKLNHSCWSVISRKCKLSTNFIYEFIELINWTSYSQNKNLTDDQLLLFKKELDWNVISKSGRSLSEEMLCLVQDCINAQKEHARIIWQNIFKNNPGYSISDSYKLSIAKVINSIY